jgi:hypothetical protein
MSPEKELLGANVELPTWKGTTIYVYVTYAGTGAGKV